MMGADGRTRGPRPATRWLLACLLAANLLQGILSFRLPGDVVSDAPLYNVDYAWIQYVCHTVRLYFADAHRVWGYDPYVLAGFPKDFVWDNSLPVQLLCLLLPFAPVALVIKGCYLLAFLLPPWLGYRGMRNLAFREEECLLGALLVFTYQRIGIARMMLHVGVLSGYLALFLGFYLFSLLYALIGTESASAYRRLLVFAPLSLTVHKSMIVILGLPALLLVALHRKALDRRLLLRLTTIGLLTLAFNAFWLPAFLHLLPDRIVLPNAPFWLTDDPWGWIGEYLGTRLALEPGNLSGLWTLTAFKNLVLLAAVFGLATCRQTARRRVLGAAAVTAGVLFLLTYYGSFWRVTRLLQPYRYVTLLNLLLVIPATVGLSYLVGLVRRRLGTAAARGALLLLVAGVLFLGLVPRGSLSAVYGPGCMETRLNAHETAIIEWIREHTDRSARILVENSTAWDREGPGLAYYGKHFPALLPLLTGRPLLGGFPDVTLRHQFANFQCGILFNRPIERIPFPEFKAYMDLYNVGWILAWSEETLRYLERYPRYFVHQVTVDRFRFYRLERDADYFLKGRGRIRFDYNRLELEDVQAEDDEIVLAFHWMAPFRACPPAILERAQVLDDPVGFIRVRNPPASFTIYNAYAYRRPGTASARTR